MEEEVSKRTHKWRNAKQCCRNKFINYDARSNRLRSASPTGASSICLQVKANVLPIGLSMQRIFVEPATVDIITMTHLICDIVLEGQH